MVRSALSRRGFLRASGLMLGLAAAGAGAGYAWWSNTLTVERHRLKLWSLTQPVRLGVLTDLHAPNYRFATFELIEAVNAAECDLLLIIGDTVDRQGNERLVPEIFQPMRAGLGKLAVLGNWEYRGGIDLAKLRQRYESADVQLLVNETAFVRLEQGVLQLIGLDDYLMGQPDLNLLKEIEDLTVVLSHCPEPADRIAEQAERPMLVVSGHTHGGQIVPFGVALYLPPGSGRFVTGPYRVGRDEESWLYVSPGLGNSGVPLRVGVRPTLTILNVS